MIRSLLTPSFRHTLSIAVACFVAVGAHAQDAPDAQGEALPQGYLLATSCVSLSQVWEQLAGAAPGFEQSFGISAEEVVNLRALYSIAAGELGAQQNFDIEIIRTHIGDNVEAYTQAVAAAANEGGELTPDHPVFTQSLLRDWAVCARQASLVASSLDALNPTGGGD